uniref:Ribonuclease H-like domain-containing protein n=1 Tax=Tanacetum cinerariifolium TaxID=118510 RepID=A0A6L2M2U5_TANCI|nr:ribonuclease H-like domain-containing protein [Tanacetum cinerariifolium]
MEAIEKRFGGNTKAKKVQKTLLKKQYANFTGSSSESLDQIHDWLQKLISQLEILGRTGRNLGANRPTSMGFDMSKVECYNCHRKGHFARECRSLKDTRRNGATKPQRRNVPVEASTSNALVSQCDDVGSYDWSLQADEEPTNYALMTISTSSSSSDNEVVSCSKACTKAYVTLKSHYDKLTEEYRKSQFDVISYQTRLESVEARLLVYQHNEYVFEKDIKLLKLEVQLRDNALVVLRQNLEKAKQERDDLKLKLDRSDESLPSSPIYDRYQSSNGYHVVHPPYTGTFMPPKPDLVFNNAPNDVETNHHAFNVKLSPTKPDQDLSYTHRHVVLEVILTQSKLVPITAVKPVSTIVPKISVTRTRQAKIVVPKTNSPPRRHTNRSLFPKASTFPPKVTVVKAPMVNAAQGKWKWKPKCLILDHVSHNTSASLTLKRFDYNDALGRSKNMSYLSDFMELNGGYITFGGNPKGCKISRKGKIRTGKLDFDDVYFVKELKFNLFSVSQMCDKKNSVLFTDTECLVLSPEFKLPDENQVLLRVPRENNMYNVILKNIVPSGDLTCLFAKAILDESNLWHRRLGHINFKTMNKLVKDSLGKFNGNIDEGFLVGYYVSSKAFRVFNSRTQIVQETMHVNFLENKPNVAGRGPTWLFDIDTLTKNMNYQPVTAGNQSNPSAGVQEQFDAEKAKEKNNQQYVLFPIWSSDFKDFSYDSINEDNAAGTLVPTVGQLSPNSTNTFSATGPSTAAASPTHGKSSCIDSSQYPDDLNMSELEDINYSDDEEDVGAEDDFNNFCNINNRHIQEEGIDYEEVFAPVAMIEAIRLFLTYASFMGFKVYQMYVKSAFPYETIKEEKKDRIFISQDKYVAEILRKFGLTDGKPASTPIDTEKPLMKDSDGEDFWTSVAMKKVNDVKRFQALFDKKKVIITKASIRDALRLDDAEGRKFNFSKYIFDRLVRNVDSSTKFYMYPCFLQLMIRKQVGDLSTHTTKYTSPALTQKVFANMRRVGKGFSGVETPLFEGMIVEQQVDKGDAEVNVDDVSTAGVAAKGDVVLLMMKFLLLLKNHLFHHQHHLLHHYNHHKMYLQLLKVEHLEQDKIAQALEITKLKSRVKKLERRNKASKIKKLKKGGIIENIDANEDVVLEDAKEVVVEKSADVDESVDIQGRKAESQAQIYQIDLEHANKVLITAASNTLTAAAPQLTTAAAPTLTTAPSSARRRKGVVRDPESATPSTIIHFEAKSKDKGKDYAQNVKNQSKTGQYRTQDWKSTTKSRINGHFS